MNDRSVSSLGLTRLLAQALFALVVGIFVSICTLAVQIFIVLSGLRVAETAEPTAAGGDSHVLGCSLCMRRRSLMSSVQSHDSDIVSNQSETSVSQVA